MDLALTPASPGCVCVCGSPLPPGPAHALAVSYHDAGTSPFSPQFPTLASQLSHSTSHVRRRTSPRKPAG